MSDERKTDNHVMMVWLQTIENTIGPSGLKSILNYAHLEKYIDNFPPDNDEVVIPLGDLQDLYCSLLELFGDKGARSLQMRIGREAARISVEKRPEIAKPVKLASHLLSESRKMRLVLERYVEQIEQRFDYPADASLIEVLEKDDCFLLVDRAWFESEGITSQTPRCGFIVGMVQYLLTWITGHHHEVEEIECRAMGDPADVVRIDKETQD